MIEVTFDEIAAEITRKSRKRVKHINSYFIRRNDSWKERDPEILKIMGIILIRIGWAAIIGISTALAMGAIVFFSGISITLAAGGPILVAAAGGVAVIGYKIYTKRAIFKATAKVLKKAKKRFDQLPSRVRSNNVELELLIDDSIRNIIITAFHISMEEMMAAI